MALRVSSYHPSGSSGVLHRSRALCNLLCLWHMPMDALSFNSGDRKEIAPSGSQLLTKGARYIHIFVLFCRYFYTCGYDQITSFKIKFDVLN